MKYKCSGQAAVELTVAIIGILVIVAGLLQLVIMITADSDTMLEASGEAAERAASSLSLSDNPDIVGSWDNGEDEMEQTKDDKSSKGSFSSVRSQITAKTVADGDWSVMDGASHDEIRRLHHGEESEPLGFVKGSSSRSIEVLPIARSLFGLDSDETIENEVWMTTSGNLY